MNTEIENITWPQLSSRWRFPLEFSHCAWQKMRRRTWVKSQHWGLHSKKMGVNGPLLKLEGVGFVEGMYFLWAFRFSYPWQYCFSNFVVFVIQRMYFYLPAEEIWGFVLLCPAVKWPKDWQVSHLQFVPGEAVTWPYCFVSSYSQPYASSWRSFVVCWNHPPSQCLQLSPPRLLIHTAGFYKGCDSEPWAPIVLF